MKNILFTLLLILPLVGAGQEVEFAIIDEVPVYPGCERGNNAEKRNCMAKNIAQFVSREFNTDIADDLGLSGKQRINVIFKIDKNGNVVEARSRAPHQILEKEAVRVVKMLPKMKPGRQRGKPVIVPYSLPITFVLQGSNTESPYNSTQTPPPPPPPLGFSQGNENEQNYPFEINDGFTEMEDLEKYTLLKNAYAYLLNAEGKGAVAYSEIKKKFKLYRIGNREKGLEHVLIFKKKPMGTIEEIVKYAQQNSEIFDEENEVFKSETIKMGMELYNNEYKYFYQISKYKNFQSNVSRFSYTYLIQIGNDLYQIGINSVDGLNINDLVNNIN
jgi:hypothetical protein